MEIEVFTSMGEGVELCKSEFIGEEIIENVSLSIHDKWFNSQSSVYTIVDDSIHEALIIYYSNQTDKFYTSGNIKFDGYEEIERFKSKYGFVRISFGLCGNGYIGIWVESDVESKLLSWHKCNSITNPDDDIVKALEFSRFLEGEISNKSNDLRSDDGRIKSLMMQYNYKVNIKIEGNKSQSGDKTDNTISSISIERFDNTFDKSDSRAICAYQTTGKPSILNITFIASEQQYSVNFWMGEDEITRIFERFYGAHPQSKADFIIRMNVEEKICELALFRQGLKEPVTIPESAYQMIVFKNQFEDYRSDNYNQPRGAWIW